MSFSQWQQSHRMQASDLMLSELASDRMMMFRLHKCLHLWCYSTRQQQPATQQSALRVIGLTAVTYQWLDWAEHKSQSQHMLHLACQHHSRHSMRLYMLNWRHIHVEQQTPVVNVSVAREFYFLRQAQQFWRSLTYMKDSNSRTNQLMGQAHHQYQCYSSRTSFGKWRQVRRSWSEHDEVACDHNNRQRIVGARACTGVVLWN